jgi:hypothetical protein
MVNHNVACSEVGEYYLTNERSNHCAE